jgi:thiamine-monophosphate kinase
VHVTKGMELSITTDMLVEGRHFLPGADPRALGHKALAVNLSDLAASGATPRWITLALAMPAPEASWLHGFSDGLFRLAEQHGIDVVGGDTTRGPILTISVTALGEVPAGKALTRSGAHPGDDIWVSGALGGAALALLHPERSSEAQKRLHEPQPRIALGERLRGLATAAIDLSDGLAGDLRHVLERSGVGAVVHYERVPKDASFAGGKDTELERRCVLSGGDDYELLFTAGQETRAAIEALSRDLALPLTRIGAIEKGVELLILDAAGQPVLAAGAFDHFADG